MTQRRDTSAALRRPTEKQLDEMQRQHREEKAAGEVRVFHDVQSIRERAEKKRSN